MTVNTKFINNDSTEVILDGYLLTWDSALNDYVPRVPAEGGSPSGPAGGNLGGTYPSPLVVDLTISGEQQGSVLFFNGTNWVQLAPGTDGYVLTTHNTGVNPTWTILPSTAPSGPAGGDLSGTYPNPTVRDLTITSEVQGSILYFDGTNWVQLSPGISGRFLRTDGAATNPVWAVNIPAGAAGGSLDGTYPSPSIRDGYVTFSKIQNITTDRLIGRDSASTGLVEEISLGNGLIFSGSQSITTNIDATSLEYNSGVIRRSALTGDITASAGSNSTTIANDAITTVKVLNDNITFAKIQNITTDRLLGRDTASTGDTEEISLNSTLEFTGSSSIQRAAISGDITIAAGSNTAAITSGVIVNADVNASAAIDFTKLQTITTDSLLGRDTVGTGALETITLNATLSMNGSNALQRAALTGDVTATAGSNATTIATDAITTTKIINDAVTFAKIQNIATDTLVGRDTTGTGDPESITLDSTLEFTGTSSIQRAAISGDITISAGSNTSAITAGAIVNADVNASAAISLSKLEILAAARIVGRRNSGTGVPEVLSLDTTLEFNGTTTSIQRAAISGDITIAAGSNASAITAGVIINADVNAGAAIDFTKLASITTDSLLGRDTAGTGSLETITLGNGLIFSGSQSITTNIDATSLEYNSGVIRRAALTGDITATAGSNTTAIAAGVIVNADVNASAAIDISKLSTGSGVLYSASGTNSWSTTPILDDVTIQRSSARPFIRFQKNNNPTDAKRWIVGTTSSTSGTFVIATESDAAAITYEPLTITRSGEVPVEVQTNDVGFVVKHSTSNPELKLQRLANTSTERNWNVSINSSGSLLINTADSTGATVNNIIDYERSGTTPLEINHRVTTDFNDNTIRRFNFATNAMVFRNDGAYLASQIFEDCFSTSVVTRNFQPTTFNAGSTTVPSTSNLIGLIARSNGSANGGLFYQIPQTVDLTTAYKYVLEGLIAFTAGAAVRWALCWTSATTASQTTISTPTLGLLLHYDGTDIKFRIRSGGSTIVDNTIVSSAVSGTYTVRLYRVGGNWISQVWDVNTNTLVGSGSQSAAGSGDVYPTIGSYNTGTNANGAVLHSVKLIALL